MQRLFYGGTNMYLGVDLGSTNIKAAIYDGSMQLVGQQSRPVEYLRENGFVEFDAERYYNELAALIAQLTRDCGVSKIRQIAFTGQAESLVCVDAEGHACTHAISWMDERSTEECKLLAAQFDAAPDYRGDALRFVSGGEPAGIYDDLGATAMDGVRKIVRDLDDAELLAWWKEIDSDEA